MARDKKEVAEGAERIYTIPLRKEWLKAARNKRGSRAVSTVKNFLFRHMNAGDVKISQRLNEKIWVRGIQKPPAKIKIKAKINEEGVVTARLPEEMIVEQDEKKKGRFEQIAERVADARMGKRPSAPEAEPKKQATLSKEETTLSRLPPSSKERLTRKPVKEETVIAEDSKETKPKDVNTEPEKAEKLKRDEKKPKKEKSGEKPKKEKT